jgi:hypothetical protein
MIKIPVNVAFSLVVFAITAGIFLLMFTSPSCDMLANQTARSIKLAIDEVASDDFPMYTGGDVPTSPIYYREAPIMLCQEYGSYSYMLAFMGGEPEYKIYYEMFPQGFFKGGAWMWSEDYPWTGSAASGFVFYGFMRGVAVASKFVTKISKVYTVWKFTKLVGRTTGFTVDSLGTLINYLRGSGDTVQIILKYSSEIDFYAGRSVISIADIISQESTGKIVKSMAEAGFLQLDSTGNLMAKFDPETGLGRLVVSNENIPVIDFVKEYDTASDSFKMVRKKFIVYQEGGGTFNPSKADFNKWDYLDLGEAPTGDWVEVQYKPDEVLKSIMDDLKETDPLKHKQMADMYAFFEEGNLVPIGDTEILKTTYGKNLHDNTFGRIKKYINQLKMTHMVDTTVRDPEETVYCAKALIEAVKESSDVEDLFKRMDELKVWGSIKDKIRTTLDLASSEKITTEHLDQFMDMVYKQSSGVMSIAKESRLNAWLIAMDDVQKYLMTNPEETATGLKTVVRNSIEALPQYDEYFASWLDDGEITKIADALHTSYHGSYEPVTGVWIKSEYVTRSNKEFWIDMANEFKKVVDNDPTADPDILKEVGNLVGYFRQDASTMNVPLWKQYPVKEARKLVYINSKSFLTPSSLISKGIIGSSYEGCLGNSICVYSHGSQMEQPIYLSEEAQRFSGNIRVWRPISPLQQIAGFQAALQHIPSHPRFYVVSPCHATAKIWKTVYDGSDTVFVYPQKIDTQGEAANYCYADNKLINAYTTIWFVGDVLTAVETVFSGGTSLFAKVWKITDPVTVGQILAEAAISWPGMPYETLDFKIMSSTKGPEIIERLKTG